MKKLGTMELDHLRVILFTKGKDSEPWIKLVFVGTDGEETEVETELDCREFVVRFNRDEDTGNKPLFSDPSKKKMLS